MQSKLEATAKAAGKAAADATITVIRNAVYMLILLGMWDIVICKLIPSMPALSALDVILLYLGIWVISDKIYGGIRAIIIISTAGDAWKEEQRLISMLENPYEVISDD